jgi:hypothetical protein
MTIMISYSKNTALYNIMLVGQVKQKLINNGWVLLRDHRAIIGDLIDRGLFIGMGY